MRSICYNKHIAKRDASALLQYIFWDAKRLDKREYTMKSLNKIRLMGRLASNPEIKILNNVKFITFSLTTTGHYYCTHTGERVEYTDFHKIVCYAGIANFVHKAIKRGNKVLINGTMRTIIEIDSDGNTHYVKKVIADSVQAVGNNLVTDQRVIFYDENGFYVCKNEAEASRYEQEVEDGLREPFKFKIIMEKEKRRTLEEVLKDPLELGF